MNNLYQQMDAIFNPIKNGLMFRNIEQRHVIDLKPEDVEDVTEEGEDEEVSQCAQIVEICPEVLEKLATHIKENCDDEGIFRGVSVVIEHKDQVISFDVNCQLLYDREGNISDVQICWASAEIHDEDGCLVSNDFKVSHLKDFLT